MIHPIAKLTAGDDSGDDNNRAPAALVGIAAAPAPLPVGPPLPSPLDLEKAFPPRAAWLREFVEAQAEETQFDPSAVALLTVVALAGAAQAAWKVRISRPWAEELPAWALILAEPGERKSALFQGLMQPVYDWERAESKRLASAIAVHQDKREALESRLRGSKTGQRSNADSAESIAELREQLMALPELVAPTLTTGQPTPEALYNLLRSNGGKFILAADEMDSSTLLGARYSEKGATNMDTILACHDGGRVAPSRAGKETPAVERACGSLVIATQPAACEELLKNPVAKQRGLLDRFWVCRIHSRMGSRELHPPPCSDVLRANWAACISGLLDQPWEGRVVLSGSGLKLHEGPPVELRLSAEASVLMDAFRGQIESRLRDTTGDLRPLSGFGSKLPGKIARLAALLELASDRLATEVSAESMAAAISWAPWLIAQTRFVRGRAAESFEQHHARRIVEAHLSKSGEGAEVSERDLFNRARTSELPTMEKARPVLTLLVDLGFLVELPAVEAAPGTPGRPQGKRYLVRLPVREAAE